MTLAEQIQTDIVVAMKARDDFKLSVLRMVKSAIQLKELENCANWTTWNPSSCCKPF